MSHDDQSSAGSVNSGRLDESSSAPSQAASMDDRPDFPDSSPFPDFDPTQIQRTSTPKDCNRSRCGSATECSPAYEATGIVSSSQELYGGRYTNGSDSRGGDSDIQMVNCRTPERDFVQADNPNDTVASTTASKLDYRPQES
ncbi:hypothetical protein M231_00513 [Tremella mesenterica]|uniref:Uncharacterized protein n=1 Tax=Tremella mesenterica TaxID=5217 RepID=A0A4Q1BVT7_TREME|nr:uncharacterized protein TREMEDRAFT_57173 [Tremella mesenterica DSM 1558]EIW68644.1 hypothetical protein TREMEDRAFT_57173 [Tremella mesenterica DSM 1558]RXK42156.1 hypothetical protein M231_00513 [Tremella mesenterica]